MALRSCNNRIKALRNAMISARNCLSCRHLTEEEKLHFDFGLDKEPTFHHSNNNKTKKLMQEEEDHEVTTHTEITIDDSSSDEDDDNYIYGRMKKKDIFVNFRRQISNDIIFESSSGEKEDDEDDENDDVTSCSNNDDASNSTQRSVRFGDEVYGQKLEVIYEVARLFETGTYPKKLKKVKKRYNNITVTNNKKHRKTLSYDDMHCFFEI